MENELGTAKISKLVFRIAIPAMLAQFVSVLYSVIDRIFIGNIPEIGDLALAGVGVAGPVLTLISAFANLVGLGGAPLVGISLGEGDKKRAENVVSNSFLYMAILSVAVIALALTFRRPLLTFFGASENIYKYAEDYFFIYCLGTFFAFVSIGMNQFIICQGYAKVAMSAVIIGTVINVILDPVFIFVFDMNVKGAALATIISQAVSATFVICFLLSKRSNVRLTFKNYSIRMIGKITSLGFSPFLIIALDNLMIIVMNSLLKAYGGEETDTLMTVNAIVQSFMLICTMPLSGISGGTQGILSYNYGARNTARVKKAQMYIMLMCAGFCTIMLIVSQFASPFFVSMFTSNEVVAAKAVRAIKISASALIPLGVQYEVVDGFTAFGKVSMALPMSITRKTFYFLALFILPATMGAEYIFYAEPFSDICGPAVCITVYFLTINKILKKREYSAPKVETKELTDNKV